MAIGTGRIVRKGPWTTNRIRTRNADFRAGFAPRPPAAAARFTSRRIGDEQQRNPTSPLASAVSTHGRLTDKTAPGSSDGREGLK